MNAMIYISTQTLKHQNSNMISTNPKKLIDSVIFMSYKFGISQIETIIPEGVNFLILGDFFSGKYIFTRQFLVEGLENDEACILLSTNETVRNILEDLKDVNLNNLGIVNCIPTKLGRDIKLAFPDQIFYVDSPIDLKDIMAYLNRLFQFFTDKGFTKIRIILDSASTLLMYSNLRTIYKFLHEITCMVKSTNAVSLIVMEDGVHDEIEIKSIKQLIQSIITMSDGTLEVEGLINIQKTYEIENNQLIINMD